MDSNVPSSLATIIFSLTAAMEFDGMLRVDVVESQAFLALYSHIRFMLCSHVPINSAEDGNAAKATRRTGCAHTFTVEVGTDPGADTRL